MNSAFKTRIQDWCFRPTEIWDNETTKLLVRHERKVLRERFSWEFNDYNTAGYILNDPTFIVSKIPISTWNNKNPIYLEPPSPNELGLFYTKNNLSCVREDDLRSIGAAKKLGEALKFLDTVPGVVDSIAQLVRVIGVLQPTSLDEDMSYSHPDVPFSIFVSVCSSSSTDASARVAESILHEAMHLRLSLIQKAVELMHPGRQGETRYFSPWHQEERPADGILHGIFVFRAILDFFRKLEFHHKDNHATKYATSRIQEISYELSQVRDFHKATALNTTGAELVRQLTNQICRH